MEEINSTNISAVIANDQLYYEVTSFLIGLNIVNVILHSLGTSLLISTYKTRKQEVQHIYLINLSITECLINLLDILRNFPELIEVNKDARVIVRGVSEYLIIFSYAGISVVYYVTMVYITLNKLMEIVLTISYPIYWNERKAKYSVYTTWVIAFFMSSAVALSHAFTTYNWEHAFFMYFLPMVDFGYVILAVLTYAFIFSKYKHSKLNPPAAMFKGNIGKPKESAFHMFRKSKFLMAGLLIMSFLVFMIIPDLIYLFLLILPRKTSKYIQFGCWISYACSNIVDAFIYIFLQRELRKVLKKKMRNFYPSIVTRRY